MLKNSYTDLKLVAILTFLSILFFFIPSLNQNPQNIVSYALLLLLLPGYSLFTVIKPQASEVAIWKRMLFSVVLGVILIAAVYLLWTYTPLMAYLNPLVEYLNPVEFYISPLLEYIPLVFILSTILILDLVIISWARRRGVGVLPEEEQPDTTKERETQPFKKKKFYYLDLLLVFLLTLLCLSVLQLSNQPEYHTIVEFILILFLPGYALISVIYPVKDDLGGIGRLIYSFASSIALTALLGILLNFTTYNLLDPILYSLSGLTLVFVLVAFLRRQRAPGVDRYTTDFSGFFKGLRGGYSNENGTERILSLVLIVSVVLVALTTFITANPMDERYTNFTVLGSDGNPVESVTLLSNENGTLTISIINQENEKTDYRLLITSGENVLMEQTVTLEDEERKDIPFTFTVGVPGTRELEFKLYKLPDNDNIYKIIKIPLTVNENPALFVEETITPVQQG